jgi:hypothetical protein
MPRSRAENRQMIKESLQRRQIAIVAMPGRGLAQ